MVAMVDNKRDARLLWAASCAAVLLGAVAGSSVVGTTVQSAILIPCACIATIFAWKVSKGRLSVPGEGGIRVLSKAIGAAATAGLLFLAALSFACSREPVPSEDALQVARIAGCLRPPCAVVSTVFWTSRALAAFSERRDRPAAEAVCPVAMLAALGALWFPTALQLGEAARPYLPLSDTLVATGALIGSAALLFAAVRVCERVAASPRPSGADRAEALDPERRERDFESILRAHEKQPLSDRELLVLVRTLDGLTGKAIAGELGISTATVGSYRARGYAKLGVSNRAGLFRLAVPRERPQDDAPGASDPAQDDGPGARPQPGKRPGRAPRLPAHPIDTMALCTAVAALVCTPLRFALRGIVPAPATGTWIPAVQLAACGALLLYGLVRPDRPEREGATSPRGPSRARELPSVWEMPAACLGAIAAAAIVSPALYRSPLDLVLALSAVCCARRALGAHARWSAGAARTVRGGTSPARPTGLPAALGLLSISSLALSCPLGEPGSLAHRDAALLPIREAYLIAAVALLALALVRGHRPPIAASPTAEGADRIEHYLKGRGLSDLQTRIVLLSLGGRTAPEIAVRLHVALGTVSSYRSRAYAILGVGNLAEARDLIARETRCPCS